MQNPKGRLSQPVFCSSFVGPLSAKAQKKKVVIECLIYFAFGGGDETVRIDFGAGCERASAGWVRQSS